MSDVAILVGTFIVSVLPAMAFTRTWEMAGWFETSTIWAAGVTLIVAGAIL